MVPRKPHNSTLA